MSPTSTPAAEFGGLLDTFVNGMPGVSYMLAVSAEGQLLAVSSELDRITGERLGATVAGMSSLCRRAARQIRGGRVRQTIIETEAVFMLCMTVRDGSTLAVVTDAICDVGRVGHELGLLASEAASLLTPDVIVQLREALPAPEPGHAQLGGVG